PPMPVLALAVIALGLVAVAFGLWRSRATAPRTTPVVVTPLPQASTYAVEASFLRRNASGSTRLVSGDRVKPGDRLSLELRTTRPVWLYVLNEDEHGERYL